MSRVGRTVALAGEAMAAGAVAVGAASVKAAVSFQSAMEKIHTQAGASQKDVESLPASVLKLAPATQQGPQALAEALFHLKSVGMDNADAMKALKTASDLAATGGADLESTTNALAGAWRSGIKGAQTFGETAATVNAIIGAGNMKMEDLTAAISTGILPAARTFGVSLKSVGAALALMTDEGVPAEDAATRLKMSLSLLGAPSMAAEKQLKSIGLTGLQLADAMRGPAGLIGAITLLKDHLDASGLSASRQAALLSRAFGGGRSSSAILTMINNLDVLRQKQEQINKSTGNYGAAVAAQRKTAQAQFALLRSSLDVIGIRIGSALLPPVTRFVTFLGRTAIPAAESFARDVARILPVKQVEDDASKIMSVIKGFLGIGGTAPKPVPLQVPYTLAGARRQQSVAALLGEQVAAAQRKAAAVPVQVPLTVAGMKQQEAFSAITGGAAAAGRAAAGGLAASLPGILERAWRKINWGHVLADVIRGAVSGAQQIGAAFLDLLSKINWIQFGTQFASVAIGLAIGIVNGLVPALMHELIHHPLDMVAAMAALIPVGRAASAITKIFGEVKFLGPLLRFFLSPLIKAGDAMESLLGKTLGKVFGPVGRLIAGFFKGAARWLKSAGEDILLGLWYGAEKAWAVVIGWLGKLGDWVLQPFGKAGSWLASKGSAILSGLLRGASSSWSKRVWPWLGKIGGWVLSRFAAAGSWLLGKGRDILSGLLGGLMDRWGAVTGWLGNAGGRIISLFARAGTWLYGHGHDVISGMLRGILDAMKGIGGWVKANVVDPVINWVKHFFGIHSPSTVMAWIGSHLMGGLFKGMAGHDLTAMVKLIFGSLPGALEALVGKGLLSLAKLPAKALSALGSLGSKALHLLGGLLGGGGGFQPNMMAGQSLAAAYGWKGAQWDALRALWTRESGWQTTATNPASGAYGIPQALPASKMASAGADWLTNPVTQIKWGLSYILQRYGSPAAAWAHELAAGWYARGGRIPGFGGGDSILAMVEPGEAIVDKFTTRKQAAVLKSWGVPGFASGGVVRKHRHHDPHLTAEQHTGETIADAYLSGLVNTLSKIRTEQSAAVRAIQRYYSGRAATAREDLIGKQTRQLTSLATRLASLTAQHNAAISYQSSVAQNLAGSGALSGLTVDPFQKGGGLKSQLRAKLAQLRKFAGAIKALKRAGLSKALLQQVIGMGPDDGYTYAEAMLSGGSSLIKQLNSTEAAIDATAGSVAHTAAVAVYGKAVVDGFKAQQAALEKQMRRLGDVMGRELARWLHVPKSRLPHFGHGGRFAADQLMITGDRGPEMVSFGQPGRVFSPEESARLARGGDGGGLHIGQVNVNHVPGYSTPKDVENALMIASRQIRLARR